MNEEPSALHTLSRYLKNRFGEPVLKIPLNGGFSCPNRDGRKSQSGCVFCDNSAFSPVAATNETVLEQLRAGKARAPKRFRKFIAYFQPYSNTYGAPDRLRELYEPVLDEEGVVGVAVGTRPDCFSEDIYAYLEDLSKRTYLSVELGLQTVHNQTLALINRCQTHEEGAAALRQLAARGIEAVVHVILGLPGENRDMMMETADILSGLPFQGIKLHQLMIVKGTELEKMHNDGRVTALSLEEYAGLAADFLNRLGKERCVHRLMADCLPEVELIGPLWSRDKSGSLRHIQEKIHISVFKT